MFDVWYLIIPFSFFISRGIYHIFIFKFEDQAIILNCLGGTSKHRNLRTWFSPVFAYREFRRIIMLRMQSFFTLMTWRFLKHLWAKCSPYFNDRISERSFLRRLKSHFGQGQHPPPEWRHRMSILLVPRHHIQRLGCRLFPCWHRNYDGRVPVWDRWESADPSCWSRDDQMPPWWG